MPPTPVLRGIRWLRAAAWVLVACGVAHLLGHIQGFSGMPDSGSDRAAFLAMEDAEVRGPLVTVTFLDLFRGFSLFFSLGSVVAGLAGLGLLRGRADGRDPKVAEFILLAFAVPGFVVSLTYFVLPPTIFLGIAAGCAVIGTLRTVSG